MDAQVPGTMWTAVIAMDITKVELIMKNRMKLLKNNNIVIMIYFVQKIFLCLDISRKTAGNICKVNEYLLISMIIFFYFSIAYILKIF